MIITVQVSTVIDRDTTISHKTEVIVDNEDEARERGAEFWKMMIAFNNGIGDAGEEA